MRRRAVNAGLVLGVIAAVAFAAVGANARAAVPRASAVRAPARLFVSAREWSLIESRRTLHSGPARIQLYNAGEDAHNLRIRRVGGTHTLTIAETRPGKLTELRTVLRPGKWKLWCSLPGHAKAGMRAPLLVRR